MIKMVKLTKGHNSGKKRTSVISVQYDPLQVMGTITRSPLKTASGVSETRPTTDKVKLLKGHYSGSGQA